MITVNGRADYIPWGYNHNAILSYDDISDESGMYEPVTIEQLKDYMRIEGFQPEEESTATEFNFDDNLIAELETSARQYIESMASISLVPHKYEVVLHNGGIIELPFSPVGDIISIYTTTGTELFGTTETDVTNYRLSGNNRKYLCWPQGNLIVTYETTAINDSRPLTDIKRIVYALYDNRGADINDVVRNLNLLLPSYSRKPFIA